MRDDLSQFSTLKFVSVMALSLALLAIPAFGATLVTTDQISVNGQVLADDWSDVSITASQVSDFNSTVSALATGISSTEANLSYARLYTGNTINGTQTLNGYIDFPGTVNNGLRFQNSSDVTAYQIRTGGSGARTFLLEDADGTDLLSYLSQFNLYDDVGITGGLTVGGDSATGGDIVSTGNLTFDASANRLRLGAGFDQPLDGTEILVLGNDSRGIQLSLAFTSARLSTNGLPLEVSPSDGRSFFNRGSVDNAIIVRDASGNDITLRSEDSGFNISGETAGTLLRFHDNSEKLAEFLGNGSFAGSSLLVNGQEVCLADGTNCISAAGFDNTNLAYINESQTFTQTQTFNGDVIIDSSGNALFKADRDSQADQASIQYRTNGSLHWTLGESGGANDFVLRNNLRGQNVLIIEEGATAQGNFLGNYNVTGNLVVAGSSLTVDGKEVCLNDSTNCQSSASTDLTNVSFINNTETIDGAKTWTSTQNRFTNQVNLSGTLIGNSIFNNTNVQDFTFGTGVNGNQRFHFLNSLNLSLKQLEEVRIQNVASLPTCDGNSQGRIVSLTTDNELYHCDGSSWDSLTDQGSAAYGDTVTGTGGSVFDTGQFGVYYVTTNSSAEASLQLYNDDETSGIGLFAVGSTNGLFPAGFGIPASSAAIVADSAEGAWIINSLGGNISGNIGSGGGANATNQFDLAVDAAQFNVDTTINGDLEVTGVLTNGGSTIASGNATWNESVARDIFVEEDSDNTLTGKNTISNSGATNLLVIDANNDTGASTSTGGAVLIENTGNVGAGLVVYSNQGVNANGHLIAARANNAAFDQSAIYISYAGTGNALNIANTGSGTGNGAINAGSTNVEESTLKLGGSQTSRGVAKITLTSNSTNVNAAALSLDIQGTNPSGQGLFIDSTATGGTTGKLVNVRNAGSEKFVVYPDGNASVTGPSFTVNGSEVCRADGTNCQASSGSTNLTNVALTNQSNTFADGATQHFAGGVNISEWYIDGNVLSYNGSTAPRIDTTASPNEIHFGKGLDLLNNTIQNFRLDVQDNQTCLNVNGVNLTGKVWQSSEDQGRINICNPGIGANGIDRVAFMRDLIGLGGASYGDTLSTTTASLFEGGSIGLTIQNSNNTAESSFFVNMADNGDSGGFQVFAVAPGNNNFLTPAESVVVLGDAANGAYFGNTLGDIIFNRGNGAGDFTDPPQAIIGETNVTTQVDTYLDGVKVNSSGIYIPSTTGTPECARIFHNGTDVRIVDQC